MSKYIGQSQTHLKAIFSCLILCFLTVATSINAWSQNVDQKDSIWLIETFKNIDITDATTSDIGKMFLGSPYVAHTLDQEKDERLTIDFEHLDCTTFVENCVALAITSPNTSDLWSEFRTNLQDLRYRDGQISGYTSRIHYFSEWIIHAEKQGRLKNISKQHSNASYIVDVNFMSSHSNRYPKLKGENALILAIKEQENEINGETIPFIQLNTLAEIEDKLPEGSIIAICTDIKGLDITHVGMITKVNGHSHLLHASSLKQQVVVSDVPLSEYLKNSKHCTGIVALELIK